MTRETDPVEVLRHYKFGGGGGLCAYAWHWAGNSFFELSTAVCSRNDQYDEAVAEKMARDSAVEFRSIKLPIGLLHDRHSLNAETLNGIVGELFTFF